ncbi:MAG: hypothetical protein QW065_03695 [Acidilobaceae archaeon]
MDLTKTGLEFIKSLSKTCGFEEKLEVKIEEQTDERFGWLPTQRPINKYIEYGMIPLDKPPGPTSHEVVAWIKRLLGVKKAGHGGTLELLEGAGTPQGHWSITNSSRESHEDNRTSHALIKGVRLRYATS